MSNFILPFNLCFIPLMGNFLVGLVIWPQEMLGNENINFSQITTKSWEVSFKLANFAGNVLFYHVNEKQDITVQPSIRAGCCELLVITANFTFELCSSHLLTSERLWLSGFRAKVVLISRIRVWLSRRLIIRNQLREFPTSKSISKPFKK